MSIAGHQRLVEGLRATRVSARGAANEGRLASALAEETPSALVVELDGVGVDRLGLVARLKSNPATASVPLLGFCGHTKVDLIAAARDAGCDRVVSRGELTRRRRSGALPVPEAFPLGPIPQAALALNLQAVRSLAEDAPVPPSDRAEPLMPAHQSRHLIRRAVLAILDAHSGVAPDLPLAGWAALDPRRSEPPEPGGPRWPHGGPQSDAPDPPSGPDDLRPGYDWESFCAARDRFFALVRPKAVKNPPPLGCPDTVPREWTREQAQLGLEEDD